MTLSVASSARLAIALAALAVLSGCSAQFGSAGLSDDAGEATPTPTPAAPAAFDGNRSATDRPDPETDVQGWERGYWYDEALAISADDGLNDSERDAVVARAMARVEHVRDVEFDDPVEVAVRNRSAIAGDVGGGGGDAGPTPASVERRALFLVGDRGGSGGGDPAGDTRTATVQGYYDPAEDRIVIVTDERRPILDEVTLAQELYHAHQFRTRPLLLPQGFTDDNLLALRTLIEGDANLVDRLYERRCAANWTCVRPDAGGGNGSDGAGGGFGAGFDVGVYLRAYVPYAEGEPLVTAVYERGGWEAVNDLYDDPPRSSEQVIHPDSRGDERPERVSVSDRSSGRWERLTRENRRDVVTVGEAGLATMFLDTAFDDRPGGLVDPESVLNRGSDGSLDPVDPVDYAVNYSTGWAGDALATYRSADGEAGYVWRLRFDDGAEAREFARGYRRLLTYRNGTDAGTHWELSGEFAGAYNLAVDERTVTVVHAPTPAGLGDLWPAASVPAATNASLRA